MSYEREISKHLVLLCPGFCLNYVGKHYRNKMVIAQNPGELASAAHSALVGMPRASEACTHLSSLPRHDQKSLLIKEIQTKTTCQIHTGVTSLL